MKIFKRLLGIRKLDKSFTLIIIFVVSSILGLNYLFRVINDFRENQMTFLLTRNQILTDFSNSFFEMRGLINVYYINPYWLETSDLRDQIHNEIIIHDLLQNMVTIVEQYRQNYTSNTYSLIAENHTGLGLLESIVLQANEVYDMLANGFFVDSDHHFDYDLLDSYIRSINESLDHLSSFMNASGHEITQVINFRTRALQWVANGIFLFLLLLVTVISLYTIRALETDKKNYRKRVTEITKGNFESISNIKITDDFSDIITMLSSSFANIISNLKEITDGNLLSNLDRRLDLTGLEGIYKETGIEINKMLDTFQAITKDNELYTLLFDTAPAVLTVWDKDYNVLETNEEAPRRYNLKNKEEYKARVYETYAPYQPNGRLSSEYAKEIITAGFHKEKHTFEWLHQTVDGELIPSEVIAFTGLYKGQDVYITYSIDLRESKKYEDQLRESLKLEEIAIQNSNAKSKFLAKMSHEIRTPISAVLGISEIQLQNNALTLEVEEAFAKIHSSSNILLKIVNDILDMSKIESGKMDVINQDYSMVDFIEDTINLNMVFLGSKQIDFKVKIDPDLPIMLYGDELRLKQIINNILSNSFKYTDFGSVLLDIRITPNEKPKYVNLVVSVEDTGRGMTKKQVSAIFDEYLRFHEREDRFTTGSGLGMPLAHSFVNLLGGNIDILSEIGEGTTVSFSIPQQISTTKTIGINTARQIEAFNSGHGLSATSKKLPVEPVSMPYGSVLIVDDVEANLYVAKGLVSLFDIKVETLQSGYDAIEKIKEGQAYDIILMDQMMPEIDGYETTQAIRALGYTGKIIAFTANALVGQAEAYIKNGFDGFLSKPIQFVHLNAILHKFIKSRHDALNEKLVDTPNLFVPTDTDQFLKNAGIDNKIKNDFLTNYSNIFYEIITAISAGELEEAHLKAHTLKSLLDLLHEEDIRKTALSVEIALKQGQLPDETDLTKLELQFDLLLTKLR